MALGSNPASLSTPRRISDNCRSHCLSECELHGRSHRLGQPVPNGRRRQPTGDHLGAPGSIEHVPRVDQPATVYIQVEPQDSRDSGFPGIAAVSKLADGERGRAVQQASAHDLARPQLVEAPCGFRHAGARPQGVPRLRPFEFDNLRRAREIDGAGPRSDQGFQLDLQREQLRMRWRIRPCRADRASAWPTP